MDKNIRQPAVSVVMSVYNGERYLREAIESILSQSYKNFEFIIINDGSTDGSKKIIQSYKDARIQLINQQNRGLVPSLNTGIKTAKGRLIARQDADDISLPDRLQIQVSYLERNPNTVLVGSSMQVMDEASNIMHTHHVLLSDPELRQELLVRSPFAHGSVVFRREDAIQAGLYHTTHWPAEDYDLWLRLSTYGSLSNINQPLYIYRENTMGISSQNHKKQIAKTQAVQELAWSKRKDLLHGFTLNDKAYKPLDDGNVRVERIFDNISFIHRKAIQKKQLMLAVQLVPYVTQRKLQNSQLIRKLKRAIK